MRCKGCGYSLWNVPGRTCPECGRGFAPSEFEFQANAVEFCCPGCMQQYYGTDEHGLPVPRAFDCVKCCAACELDSMILRVAPGVREDAVELHRVPWEQESQGGRFRRFWRTIGESLRRPTRLGMAIRAGADARRATWFALAILFGALVPTALLILAFGLIQPLWTAGTTRTGASVLGAEFWQGVVTGLEFLVGFTLGMLASLALLALVARLLLRLLGERVTWRTVWCSAAYSVGPFVFLAIPCLGPYCGGFPMFVWFIVAWIIVLVHAAAIPGWKVCVAVIAPVVLLMLLAIGGFTTLLAMAPTPVVAPVTVTASPAGQGGDEEATEPSAAPGTPAASDAARDSEATTPEQSP